MTSQQKAILNALVTFAAENVPGGLSDDEREVAQIVGAWVHDDEVASLGEMRAEQPVLARYEMFQPPEAEQTDSRSMINQQRNEAVRRNIITELRRGAGIDGAHGSMPALALAADWLDDGYAKETLLFEGLKMHLNLSDFSVRSHIGWASGYRHPDTGAIRFDILVVDQNAGERLVDDLEVWDMVAIGFAGMKKKPKVVPE